MNTITIVGPCGYRRGDDADLYGLDGKRRFVRVLRASASVLTVRDRHSWRAVEWVRARYEDARWFVADHWPRMTVK